MGGSGELDENLGVSLSGGRVGQWMILSKYPGDGGPVSE